MERNMEKYFNFKSLDTIDKIYNNIFTCTKVTALRHEVVLEGKEIL
jgi:hypothetical protein